MVSMKDIARECGVSVATVSKALNHYSDIGKETRDRIIRIADEMGYFPNSSARALKTKRTYHLGVLFMDEANSGLTHHFFARILESFKVAAEKEGYDITFVGSSISKRKTSYLEHCRYRGVDGVMIANIDFYDAHIQELIMSDLPVITIDHVFDNRISVVSDNVGGMRALTEYVLSKGHRRIAYIHGLDSSVTRARLSSFYSTLSAHGIRIPEAYERTAAYLDVNAAAEQTEALLSLEQPPTCILYPDDICCLGGINRLRAKGLRVGEDISVAGYDGDMVAHITDPQITTIAQDTTSIGQTCARKLIDLIENPKSTIIEQILIRGTLEEGASVAAID